MDPYIYCARVSTLPVFLCYSDEGLFIPDYSWKSLSLRFCIVLHCVSTKGRLGSQLSVQTTHSLYSLFLPWDQCQGTGSLSLVWIAYRQHGSSGHQLATTPGCSSNGGFGELASPFLFSATLLFPFCCYPPTSLSRLFSFPRSHWGSFSSVSF